MIYEAIKNGAEIEEVRYARVILVSSLCCYGENLVMNMESK